MARLKSEFLRIHRARHGATRRDRLVAGSPAMAARLAGRLAPIVNAVQNLAPVRGVIASVTGFTPRRRLPAYAREPFADWFDRRGRAEAAGAPAAEAPAAGAVAAEAPAGGAAKAAAAGAVAAEAPAAGVARGSASRRVALFDDTYLSYHEPRIGRAAVELLESCGYEVILARAGCCQRPRISHGFLVEAKRDGERTLRNLDRFLAEGVPVVACEPSCAAALVDDLPDLVDDEALGRRAREGILMVDQFLAREVAVGQIAPRFVAPVGSVMVHGHCHQKAIFGTEAMMEILGRVPGLRVREVDAGCCGMAGSFGYEREHYELSMRVGEDRLFPAIRSLDAETAVVACGFSCRHQIADATGRRAVHWVEVVRGVGAPSRRRDSAVDRFRE
jgi:Fe-S oxidoreductase